MRRRLYAVVAVAALGLALPSHAEDPKKLDGDKVKKIEATVAAAQNFNAAENVTSFLPGAADRMKCQPPRCARLDFIFAPAAGVTGDVVIRATWASPASDIDIYLVDANNKDIAHCASFGGTGEIFAVKADKLTKDAKYTVITDFFQTAGENVTTSVEFPATYTPSDTTLGLFDCALDG